MPPSLRSVWQILLSCLAILAATFPVSIAKAVGPFPVTVQHALGSTVIKQAPGRIVSLGWSGEDSVIALGKTPVGIPRYRFFADGMFPWNAEHLRQATPALLDSEIDYEQIAALQPDLILGIYSGIDLLAYKRLSLIAPTVVYRSGPWEASWKEQTEIIGEALGMADDAQKLIVKTETTLSALGTDHPVLKGKTFTFGTFFPGGAGVVVYLSNDPRVSTLMELGLKPAPGIVALSQANPETSSTLVSLENLGSIDADVLIMWYGEGARAAAEAQPLFAALGAVKRGSYVALDDPVAVWSTSALSVLSIPYGFPKFVPRLAEAARKAKQQ